MPSYNMKRAAIRFVLICLPSLGFASPDVPPAYKTVASSHGIPAKLFYAIALTESGRKLASTSKIRPWPWSANFGGRGQFFESRHDARRVIQDYLNSGRRSVDIGLMQINWRYHHDKLGSVWQALDPHHNLHEAAKSRIWCQARHQDWWASVGCYHAPSNPARAARYRQRVREQWSKLDT